LRVPRGLASAFQSIEVRGRLKEQSFRAQAPFFQKTRRTLVALCAVVIIALLYFASFHAKTTPRARLPLFQVSRWMAGNGQRQYPKMDLETMIFKQFALSG